MEKLERDERVRRIEAWILAQSGRPRASRTCAAWPAARRARCGAWTSSSTPLPAPRSPRSCCASTRLRLPRRRAGSRPTAAASGSSSVCSRRRCAARFPYRACTGRAPSSSRSAARSTSWIASRARRSARASCARPRSRTRASSFRPSSAALWRASTAWIPARRGSSASRAPPRARRAPSSSSRSFGAASTARLPLHQSVNGPIAGSSATSRRDRASSPRGRWCTATSAWATSSSVQKACARCSTGSSPTSAIRTRTWPGCARRRGASEIPARPWAASARASRSTARTKRRAAARSTAKRCAGGRHSRLVKVCVVWIVQMNAYLSGVIPERRASGHRPAHGRDGVRPARAARRSARRLVTDVLADR